MSNEKKCNGKMEIFSRVTGYYQRTAGFNPGKKEEFRLRKTYDLNKAIAKCDDNLHDKANKGNSISQFTTD